MLPWISVDAGRDDLVGERLEWCRVEHRIAVDRLGRVVRRRQDGVAAADEIEVTGDHTARDRAPHVGPEPEVGAEHVQCRGGDEQFLVARRDHREVGVMGADLDTVELHDHA